MIKKEIRLNVPVYWFCNQKCIFCWEWDKKEYLFMKGKEDQYVYELIDYGIKNHNAIMFTTWEPTLNKNLELYIKYAKKLGYKNIWLITNWSTFVDDNLRNKIINAWISEITFSFHWSNSKIHDFNTWSKWHFNKALLALVKLRKENKDISIYTNFVLNKSNLLDLFNYIYKFSRLWVNKIFVHNMRPDWYAKDNMINLSIRFEDFIKYIIWLWKEKLYYLNSLVKDGILLIKDIPDCIFQKTWIKINIVYNQWKMETIDKWKIWVIDFQEDKIYIDICNKCQHKDNCTWIFRDYIDMFWKDEFMM